MVDTPKLARMLACDCARVDVQASESGEVLDVGRSRRTIPNAIARALWIRDGGCRCSCMRASSVFRNVHGLTLKPVPERGNEEIEAVTRWLNAVEPELDGDNYPKWDGSRLDLDAVLSWMFAAEARAAA